MIIGPWVGAGVCGLALHEGRAFVMAFHAEQAHLCIADVKVDLALPKSGTIVSTGCFLNQTMLFTHASMLRTLVGRALAGG